MADAINGDALVYDNGTWVPGGAGTSAGGSNTQVQFNDGGSALGGSANFTWDNSEDRLAVSGNVRSLPQVWYSQSFTEPPADMALQELIVCPSLKHPG